MASGVDTHTHTHTHTHTLADESDYKKPGAPGLRPARTWFLIITFARECMRVCVCVCVCVRVCMCVRPQVHKLLVA